MNPRDMLLIFQGRFRTFSAFVVCSVFILLTDECSIGMEMHTSECGGAKNDISKNCVENDGEKSSSQVTQGEAEPLQLPPAGANDDDESESRRTLDLGTGAKDLTDELGPLVINKDGTTARITNWHKMTSDEKERTLRVITKRNRERLAVLKQEL